MTTVKILTLNCWGVPLPIVCKNRRERFESIGEELSKRDYDIVLLEEVWLTSDYKILCDKIGQTLPHSHYFYSGLIGSGCCIFSKYHLGESIFHIYSLNGFAHKVHHGDWFAGKGIGMSKVIINGLHINLYSSHIHAEYNRTNDEYLSHRMVQAFEASQFIKHTSQTCDVAILAGDLNFEPVDLGYRVIMTNANLRDCWIDKKKTTGVEHGNTDEVPTNSYCNPECLKVDPQGKRIDYIMYRGNPGVKVNVEEATVTMGRIPGKQINFSDHEGLETILKIEKNSDSANNIVNQFSELERNKNLEEAIEIVDCGVQQSRSDESFFKFLSLILLLLLYLLNVYFPVNILGVSFILLGIKLVLALALAFCFWTGFIVKKMDIRNFDGVKLHMDNVIKNSKLKSQ